MNIQPMRQSTPMVFKNYSSFMSQTPKTATHIVNSYSGSAQTAITPRTAAQDRASVLGKTK